MHGNQVLSEAYFSQENLFKNIQRIWKFCEQRMQ